MALSDMAVRQAKAIGKAYTLGDIDGLSIAVSEQGSRSWHFRYSWAGKQKRMSLGTYPEIGLREARALRNQARALLAKGINPKLDRKHKCQAVRLADEHTFNAVFLQRVEHRRLELKEGRNSTLSQIQRIFDRDVLPSLGNISIYDIRRTDLLEVVARIEQRKAFTTAEKVRTWFNQLFRFALVKVEALETNPASDLDVVAVPAPPVTHNPFLRLRVECWPFPIATTFHPRAVHQLLPRPAKRYFTSKPTVRGSPGVRDEMPSAEYTETT